MLHPPTGRARGSPNHSVRYDAVVFVRARKLSGCSTPLAGRPQRPLAAPANTGSRPTVTAASANPLTTWRQPKAMPTRSFSKDEIPRPIPAATAMAAGTRTTDSEGVNRPVHPCVAANASTHEAEAIAHKRAAHT